MHARRRWWEVSAFVLNGQIFTVAASARILGGGGGARIIDPVTDAEMGGGGGLGIILNTGTLVVDGYVSGGSGGTPKSDRRLYEGQVPEGSPGGGVYMRSSTTVNLSSTGSIVSGAISTPKMKSPPALILDGSDSVINNQGTIARLSPLYLNYLV